MTRPRRRVHRFAWAAIAAVVPLLLLAAFVAVRQGDWANEPAVSGHLLECAEAQLRYRSRDEPRFLSRPVVGASVALQPNATIETLLIRGLGTAALALLHVILCIGPLTRLDSRFLPLLYNRRHMGVTMFLLGLSHAVFAMVQFHALGDRGILLSLLTTNRRVDSLHAFPFELLGLAALLILFLMASTSHDFG